MYTQENGWTTWKMDQESTGTENQGTFTKDSGRRVWKMVKAVCISKMGTSFTGSSLRTSQPIRWGLSRIIREYRKGGCTSKIVWWVQQWTSTMGVGLSTQTETCSKASWRTVRSKAKQYLCLPKTQLYTNMMVLLRMISLMDTGSCTKWCMINRAKWTEKCWCMRGN